MPLSVPAFHVSDTSLLRGEGHVALASRQDLPQVQGTFDLKAAVQFLAADSYPSGVVSILVNLNDGLNGVFNSTSIDLINSHGTANPTVFVTGKCNFDPAGHVKALLGLRFWLTVAKNSRDGLNDCPDIVGFAVHDRGGVRVAYGMGPVSKGVIFVQAEF